MSPCFYYDRAILWPTIESVEQVNGFILTLLNGEEKNILVETHHTNQMKFKKFKVNGLHLNS